MAKKLLIGFGVIFIIIQLVPNKLPEVKGDNPADFLVNNEVPEEFEAILRASCYDCHSNETHYPWYSYVAPVSWLVKRDTEHGRGHLNFSEWQTFEKADMAEAYYEIADEVGEGEMPMKIYPLMHSEAKLTDEQRQSIVAWAEAAAEKLYE